MQDQKDHKDDLDMNLVKDPWRIFRIMGEFVDGFDALSKVA